MSSLATLSRRERLWILLAGIVVVLALVDKLVLSPLSRQIRETDKAIAAANDEMVSLHHICAVKTGVEAEYAKAIGPLISVESDEQELSRMLAAVEGVARSATVDLAATNQKGTEDGGWYHKFNVEVKATGTAEHLTQFFYRLCNEPVSLGIDELQISATEKNSPVLKATLTVSKVVSREGVRREAAN